MTRIILLLRQSLLIIILQLIYLQKFVNTCRTIKYVRDVHTRKTSYNGYDNICKVCRKNSDKEYYLRNKNEITKYKLEYCNENNDKIAKYKTKYYELNKKELLERNKEYRKLYKDKIVKDIKEYYEDNNDKVIN